MAVGSGREWRHRRQPLVPPPVYAIADAATLGLGRVLPAIEIMVAVGIRWIQLRARELPDRDRYAMACDACRAVAGSGACLWMNDRADLATLLPFSGLHLGQDDLPPNIARTVVGQEMWIGRSTHDAAEVSAAERDPAVDVVAVGPVFNTGSKANAAPEVGLEFVRTARALTKKPLLAIGGISVERVTAVQDAGADCVVVLGAICRGDVAENGRRLLAAAASR